MYKCIENINKIYTSTGGQKVEVPKKCDYSVYWIKDDNKIHVLDIGDHLKDPKSVGQGICKLLNKGDIVLDLM